MGITHHVHGVENVQAIANLALLRGMVGRPHAGLLPIRGHSNVQGIGSVGVTPQAERRRVRAAANAFRRQAADDAGPGHDGLHRSGRRRADCKFGFCLGGNLYGSNPDATFAARALGKLDMLVYLNTTLNTGHAHGLAEETIILPVLARDEEPQPTTQESMFNFVRLSDGGPARHAGPRSEVEIDRRAGRRACWAPTGPIDWQAMAKHAPDSRGHRADRAGLGADRRRSTRRSKSFRSPAGRLHEPRFPTADGRARLQAARTCPSWPAATANCG